MFPSNILFSKLLVDLSTYDIKKSTAGKGAYGIVHEAIRPASKRHPELKCAVKYLESARYKTKEDQKSFHNEVACQSSLKHVAILPLIGYTFPFQGKGDYAIVTEFMENGSLQQLNQKVESGQAPENWDTIKAINIFGIAAGMAYVHQHDVIHRDLKTENILLDENYYPKIADFGLSKVFEEGTQNQINQTLSVGTPIYMAPEIIEDVHYTNKIDVFSYAIILYELTTQHKPWNDKKNLQMFSLLKFVKDGVRPTIRDREIPDEYVDLIDKCWSGDPEVRPSFIEIVKLFMDEKEKYFDLSLVNEEELDDYIASAIEGLDFSGL